ncbi:MAG: TetR/AcrR family transcriptional regulator [Salinisphaeraceae bacterium]|nr:TetR/AcrR family transcriptional regulator [Salinisphaeraceae bacterium]
MTANKRLKQRQYGGQSMEKRRTDRRLKLVAAAKVVMGEQGFQAATVKKICSEAQLTERYFYESFENLDDLFNAVYDTEIDRLRESLLKAITDAAPEPEAMARKGLEALFGFFKQDPQAARIVLIEIYSTQQDLMRLYKRGVQDFAELIRIVLDRQFKQVKKSSIDPALIATALVGAATQLAVRWYLSGYEQSEAVMVENCMLVITAMSDKLTA